MGVLWALMSVHHLIKSPQLPAKDITSPGTGAMLSVSLHKCAGN